MPSSPLHQNLAANPAAVLFKRRFGHPPALLVRAPGTLQLLGSLASAAEGLSLSVAVERYVSLAAAPRTDGRIELIHPLAPDGYAFWLSKLSATPDHEWASPPKAVLAALQRRGVHFSGFSAAIHDAVPPGLGADAALNCATALLVRQMFPFTLTDSGLGAPPKRDPRTQRLPELTDTERRQIAKLCGLIRTPDASLPVDHYTPLFARSWQALVVDWQSGAVERWPFAGTAVVLCDAGSRKGSTGDSPVSSGDPPLGTAGRESWTVDSGNETRLPVSSGQWPGLPNACEVSGASVARGRGFAEQLASASRKLGVRSLRSVEPAFLSANRARLEPREAAAVSQVVAENHWIVRAESALRDGDHRQLGQFLLLSHESARDALQAVPPEAEALAKVARAHRSCVGVRALFGEGRIATVSLVNYHEVEAFTAHLAAEGERLLDRVIQPVVLPIVDGAS